ncbi:MAG TPA: hypothetical protein VGD46_08545, partial [Rhizobacter sp.]
VTAPQDRANNDLASGRPSAKGPTPVWRLVPTDNNIAMRALIPVPGGGGRCALEAAFCNRKFWAHNPFAKTARMEVRAVLPALLESRGWTMHFHNPGGSHFTLGPRGEREIRPVLVSGRDFSPGELADEGPATIIVLVLANGIVVGGMSYRLDGDMEAPASERPPKQDCRPQPAPCRDDPPCDDRPGDDKPGHDEKPCEPPKPPRGCCEPCVDDRCCPPPACC